MIGLSRFLSISVALRLAATALEANEARVVFHCDSVRLRPAMVNDLGLEYRLEATTTSDGTINDEIGVADTGDYLRATTLVLTGPTFPQPLRVACGVEVPDPADSNMNGISEFFEVDCAVTDLRSVGEFELKEGPEVFFGLLDLTWNRSAGATAGTCLLRFVIEDLGIDLTFRHDFEVYDYRGTLAYTVEGSKVTGRVRLIRLGGTETLAGPVAFRRLNQAELEHDALAWTNQLGQAITFFSSLDTGLSLLRGVLRTNYYTTFYTEDGWPASDTVEEYEVWRFHLFDPNDGDRDGIPDFSDDPSPPQPPSLTIRLVDQRVQLEILAEVGHEATLEQAANLPSTNWTVVEKYTVTKATQTIELAAPVGPTFWRVRLD